ncbi:hypothetical protein Fmac_005716 [Flemingia macrophylla]|uniref:Uncharacterized protein n=1 Tax=Flemingia macrophylla TaxID=520843 RepID=A0ABD1N921_9FABA
MSKYDLFFVVVILSNFFINEYKVVLKSFTRTRPNKSSEGPKPMTLSYTS